MGWILRLTRWRDEMKETVHARKLRAFKAEQIPVPQRVSRIRRFVVRLEAETHAKSAMEVRS
jgi:hypothetical protein